MTKNTNIIASIIMPVYNEENYIENCIESLLSQSFPREFMEWIFVDGMSSDDTLKILKEYQLKFPDLIRIFYNPHRIVPCAMNIGIKNSMGQFIIRLDAHSSYSDDYISKCIYYLKKNIADNVGGVATTKSEGFIGNCIAKILSSKFGVGNSAFRVNGKSGYVDTVPFGAFPRATFKKYGGYDERLIRNQDNELNYRIRKNGGRIYLSDDIHLSYYCRNSVRGIVNMAFNNGKWNIITTKLCPGSMRLRHFIPLLFVLSIPTLLLLGFFFKVFDFILIFELILYLVMDFYSSFKSCYSAIEFITLWLLFPLFHFSYGTGSLLGLFVICKKEYRNTDYKAPVL